MGDPDYGTNGWLGCLGSSSSLSFCRSCARRRWEKTSPAVSPLRSLGTAQRLIQKPEALMNCANSVNEHLLSCCFDEEAALHQL